jgi:hypothetical protein
MPLDGSLTEKVMLLEGYLYDIFKCITEILQELSNVKEKVVQLCEVLVKCGDT